MKNKEISESDVYDDAYTWRQCTELAYSSNKLATVFFNGVA
jgi:surface antigen